MARWLVLLCALGSTAASERQVELRITGAGPLLALRCLPAAAYERVDSQTLRVLGLASDTDSRLQLLPGDPQAADLSLSFDRLPQAGLDDVGITATFTHPSHNLGGLLPVLTAATGTASAVTDLGAGRYRWVLSPSATGEHPVRVDLGGLSAEATPLVFDLIHDDLGQPVAVPGLVNTPGWEDGLTTSPDGRWLFIQYGPVRASGFLYHLGDVDHPWNTEIVGPYAAPERPDFFDTRLQSGTVEHYVTLAPQLGPIYSPPTLFFGFERQPDGRYADPFLIAMDDHRGANWNPYGMSFRFEADDTATMIFSFNDGLDQDDTGMDVYTTTITLGQTNIIGRWLPTVPISVEYFNAVRLGFSDLTGEQGNAHLQLFDNGAVDAVFTDAERESQNLTVHVLDGSYPEGPWTSTTMPAPITTSGHQFQPFFDGSDLYFTSDEPFGLPNLRRSAYQGGGYAEPGAWAEPEILLGAATYQLTEGVMWGAGETSIAIIDGVPHLFFVYPHVRAMVDGEPDIDMDCGMVPLVGAGISSQ